jgi:hypothetical protein
MEGNALIRKKLAKVLTDSKESWWMPELFEAAILEKLPSTIEVVALPPREEKNYNWSVL